MIHLQQCLRLQRRTELFSRRCLACIRSQITLLQPGGYDRVLLVANPLHRKPEIAPSRPLLRVETGRLEALLQLLKLRTLFHFKDLLLQR